MGILGIITHGDPHVFTASPLPLEPSLRLLPHYAAGDPVQHTRAPWKAELPREGIPAEHGIFPETVEGRLVSATDLASRL